MLIYLQLSIMSGPVSSLNKSRRMPFKSSNATSSRPTNSRQSSNLSTSESSSKKSSPRLPPMTPLSLDTVMTAAAEDDAELTRLANEVLDDEVARKIRRDRQQQQQQKFPMPSRFRQSQQREQPTTDVERRPSSSRSGGSGAATDAELLSSAVSRVGALQRLCNEQRTELERRQRRIDVLEDKVRLLTTATAAAKGSSREVDSLRTRCRELQKQVHEMENFLADYGLIWVGEDEDAGSSDDEANKWNWDPSSFWRPSDSTSPAVDTSKPMEADFFNRLLESINELNRLVGEDELKVTKTGTGATLARQTDSAVPLCIYANGLALWDGPFRLYSDATTQQFINDILDGYFPTELQSRYPDGVAFVVSDRREVEFNGSIGSSGFSGQGRTLGGGEGASNQRFLSRLPASVVAKSGQIVDIRQSVAAALEKPQALQQSNVLIDVSGDTPSDKVASVKIRANIGTYVIRMPFSEKVSIIFRLLRDRGVISAPNQPMEEFVLVNAYPRSTIRESNSAAVTIEESGLAPNATLMLLVQRIDK